MASLLDKAKGAAQKVFGGGDDLYAHLARYQKDPNIKEAQQRLLTDVSEGARAKDIYRGRRLIVWEVPFVANALSPSMGADEEQKRRFIQMYVNPQNLQFSSRKLITETRTKGGFVSQYWGEELDSLNLQGTTGDAGIEGINVLRDIYRAEQIALLNLVRRTAAGVKRRQSLMQLAASMIMWYDGQGFAGYFTDMSYTESAQKPGVFDYQLNFKVTRVIGQRGNFMPWHRQPNTTMNIPLRRSELGKNYTDGNLNIPPMADRSKEKVKANVVQEDGSLREVEVEVQRAQYHKRDPRDLAGAPEVKRYDDQLGDDALVSGEDFLKAGLKATVKEGLLGAAAKKATQISNDPKGAITSLF